MSFLSLIGRGCVQMKTDKRRCPLCIGGKGRLNRGDVAREYRPCRA